MKIIAEAVLKHLTCVCLQRKMQYFIQSSEFIPRTEPESLWKCPPSQLLPIVQKQTETKIIK